MEGNNHAAPNLLPSIAPDAKRVTRKLLADLALYTIPHIPSGQDLEYRILNWTLVFDRQDGR